MQIKPQWDTITYPLGRLKLQRPNVASVDKDVEQLASHMLLVETWNAATNLANSLSVS